MRKMSLLLLKVLLLNLILFCPGKAILSELIIYQNKKDNFQFTYPSTWILKSDQEKDGYLALFDPIALSKQSLTLELVVGIKLEFICLKEEEEINSFLKGLIATQVIEKENKKIQLYEELIDDCLIIVSPITIGQNDLMVLGYIPQKDKIGYYRPIYNQIVLSIN